MTLPSRRSRAETMHRMREKRGFTLIDTLVTVGIIGVLASIAIVAVNPIKQLTDAQNAKRKAFVRMIEKASADYTFNVGVEPANNIPNGISNALPICNHNLAQLPNSETLLAQVSGGSCSNPTSVYTVGSSPTMNAIGDLNGDGKNDIVVADSGINSSGNNTISVLLNNGDGTFAPKADYVTGSTPISVAIGDFNGDGKNDVVSANYLANGSISVLMNNGNGTFASKVDYSTGGQYPDFVQVADVNGDGKPDIVTTNLLSNKVTVFINNGSGTFSTVNTYATGSEPNSVAIGDVNGDGHPDLVITNLIANTVSVLLNNGNGTFAPKTDYTVPGSYLEDVVIGDLNGDTKPDLAISIGNDSLVAVLMNNGTGTFAAPVYYSSGWAPYSIMVGDVNGDGKADLVTSNDIGTISVFLNNGNGTFASHVDYGPAGGNSYYGAMGDINGDGKLDVVTDSYTSNTANILFNNGSGVFSPTCGSGTSSAGTCSRPPFTNTNSCVGEPAADCPAPPPGCSYPCPTYYPDGCSATCGPLVCSSSSVAASSASSAASSAGVSSAASSTASTASAASSAVSTASSAASENCINLDDLVPKYLTAIPVDDLQTDLTVTGYKMYLLGNVERVCNIYLPIDDADSCSYPAPPTGGSSSMSSSSSSASATGDPCNVGGVCSCVCSADVDCKKYDFTAGDCTYAYSCGARGCCTDFTVTCSSASASSIASSASSIQHCTTAADCGPTSCGACTVLGNGECGQCCMGLACINGTCQGLGAYCDAGIVACDPSQCQTSSSAYTPTCVASSAMACSSRPPYTNTNNCSGEPASDCAAPPSGCSYPCPTYYADGCFATCGPMVCSTTSQCPSSTASAPSMCTPPFGYGYPPGCP